MEGGQPGTAGVVVQSLVEVDYRNDHVLVPIPLRNMAGRNARETIRRFALAMKSLVQVRGFSCIRHRVRYMTYP